MSIHARLRNNTLNERGFAPAAHYRSLTMLYSHKDPSPDPLVQRSYAPQSKHLCSVSQLTQEWVHTATIAFRHLALNAATTGHATEGAHDSYISAQLFAAAVSALRKVWDSGSSIASKHARGET